MKLTISLGHYERFLTFMPTSLDGLIHNRNGGVLFYQRGKNSHISIPHSQASMAYPHADTSFIVRTMQQITR